MVCIPMRTTIRLLLAGIAVSALITGRGVAVPPPEPAAIVSGDAIVIPVAGVAKAALRDDFDNIHNGHPHHAIDILAPRGTPVLAAVDGTIRKLFESRAGGLTIYEFDVATERSYYYAHLDAYASDVVEGMRVKQGDVIGYVGTTGNAPPETPHLHFAITLLPPNKAWSKGEAIDPYPILVARGVTRTE
jgi:murein DD-endopeptidase MepM/ murein hydrolase activator NlpD